MVAAVPPKKEFIVAEVSRNYCNGKLCDASSDIISVGFERVITVNRQRGYVLHSWEFKSDGWTAHNGDRHLNETIVAVFELND